MLNAFSRFFRQHGEMKAKQGVYKGGDAIYAVAVDEKGKSGVLKISRQSELVATTGFEDDGILSLDDMLSKFK